MLFHLPSSARKDLQMPHHQVTASFLGIAFSPHGGSPQTEVSGCPVQPFERGLKGPCTGRTQCNYTLPLVLGSPDVLLEVMAANAEK